VLVVEPRFRCAFAILRGADKDRAEVDPGEVQPLLEGMERAGLDAGTSADLDLALTDPGVERQHCAVFENLDPTPAIGRVFLAVIEADALGAPEAAGIAQK